MLISSRLQPESYTTTYKIWEQKSKWQRKKGRNEGEEKKSLSQQSLQLAISILHVSTTDLYKILQEGGDEVSYFKDFSKKRHRLEDADYIPPWGKRFAGKDWNFIVQDRA